MHEEGYGVEKKKMTKAQIKQLANEIRQFLLERDMWIDTTIYFNGKAYSTDDRAGHYYYNDGEHMVVLEDQDPAWYVEYVGEVLTMTFEGPFYDVMNYSFGTTYEAFNALLRKWGLYGELGYAWSLGVFYA